MPLRIAVSTRCFQQPIRTAIQSAAASGAEAVQIDARNELRPADLSETGQRQFLHYLGELGIGVAALTFPTRHPLADPRELEARLSAIKSAMTFAWKIKARVVTVHAGAIPPALDSEEYTMLVEILNDLARHGNRVGATLALTPGREPAEALGRLVEAVTEGPLGVNFDPAAFVLAGHSPAESVRALHAALVHVQARDAVAGVDSGQEVPLGRGEVEWVEFLALLQEADYRGWLAVDRTQGNDRAGDAARAIQYLRNVALG